MKDLIQNTKIFKLKDIEYQEQGKNNCEFIAKLIGFMYAIKNTKNIDLKLNWDIINKKISWIKRGFGDPQAFVCAYDWELSKIFETNKIKYNGYKRYTKQDDLQHIIRSIEKNLTLGIPTTINLKSHKWNTKNTLYQNIKDIVYKEKDGILGHFVVIVGVTQEHFIIKNPWTCVDTWYLKKSDLLKIAGDFKYYL